ncbi:hypothetical protein CC79DRAFT_1343858 [Sarocladium strictum]
MAFYMTFATDAPFSTKRGIAYNDAQLAQVFSASCKTCTWAYNWASHRDGFGTPINFIPMLWSDNPELTKVWAHNAETYISEGSKALFSFNEPDIKSQASMAPQRAAKAYVKHMNRFSGKALLGAPAISNSGVENKEPKWVDNLFENNKKAYEICEGKPIWMTELGTLGSDEVISDFISDVIPKLDQIEYLHAYSYFMVPAGRLMNNQKELSSYGEIYESSSSSC